MAEDTSSYPTSLDTWTAPVADDEVLSETVRKLQSAVANLQTKIGVDSSTVQASLDSKIFYLQDIGPTVNAKAYGLSESGTASANTTVLQTLLNLAVFGPLVVYVPPGDYDVNALTITNNYVTLRGAGKGATTLYYQGSSAGAACISLTGDEDGATYTGRIYDCGIEDIALYNQGNSDSIGVNIFAGTHHHLTSVGFTGFRRHAIKAVNWADSHLEYCTFEYSGSADDTDNAVIDFSDSGSTEWAVDQIKFYDCRFENNSDRLIEFVGGTYYVNKIYFIGCKFESSTTDGNGLAGTHSQFYLQFTNHIVFDDCDFTLQGLQSGTHAIIPRMFYLNGCNGVHWTGCSFAVGAVGAIKPFTTWFDCDGTTNTNYALLWTGCDFTTGNAASPPTQVWKWTSNNRKVGRKNVTWGYVAGGGSPTADSGSPTSSSDY